MKIAIIGNMNNMMTPTATYLASNGHNVTVFMLFEYDHFHPQADYWEEVDLGFKIVNLNLEYGQVLEIPKKKLKQWFNGFDFYFGMDWSPALLARIGLKLDFYQPAGTDIIYWPFCNYTNKFYKIWQCQNLKRAWLQKFGIQKAAHICLSEENELLTNALQKMGIKESKKVFNLPHINVPLFLQKNQYQRQDVIQKVNDKIKDFDFVVFQHVRQWWMEDEVPAHYRNDILIRAFAAFVADTDKKSVLIVCEYGPDVEKSRQLVTELGIQNNVIWLPKMLRKELMYFLNACHLWVGELGMDSYIQYGSLIEALVAGKQAISYWNPDLYKSRFEKLPQIISTQNKEELTALIQKASEEIPLEKNEYNIAWIQEYIWNRPLACIDNYLSGKKGKAKMSLVERGKIQWKNFYYNMFIMCNYIQLGFGKLIK